MMAQSSAVAHGQNRYAQLSAEAQTYRHLLRLHIKESLVARGLAVPTGLASEIRRVQNSEDAEGQLEAAFTRLVNRFERQYHTVVQNFVSATEISAVSTELHVVGVVQEIFGGNQVNWGCFVALSAFITYIAFECIRTEQPHLIEPLVDHTAQTIDEQAIAFIRQNGGWTGFVRFFNEDDVDVQRDGDGSWSTLSRFATYAAGAIGVGVLAAFLAHKPFYTAEDGLDCSLDLCVINL